MSQLLPQVAQSGLPLPQHGSLQPLNFIPYLSFEEKKKTICEQGKILEINKTESEEWEAGASY